MQQAPCGFACHGLRSVVWPLVLHCVFDPSCLHKFHCLHRCLRTDNAPKTLKAIPCTICPAPSADFPGAIGHEPHNHAARTPQDCHHALAPLLSPMACSASLMRVSRVRMCSCNCFGSRVTVHFHSTLHAQLARPETPHQEGEKQPRSRYRADGRRRRTAGELRTRAPYVQFWKDVQARQRQQAESAAGDLPSRRHHAQHYRIHTDDGRPAVTA